MSTVQTEFLIKAAAAARAAGHIFPEMAACEAALESAWGLSKLAEEANNLFGQKQDHGRSEGGGSIVLPTREFLHGAWVTVNASWVKYPDWRACFAGRMEILRALSHEYQTYADALRAATGEAFVHEVSKRWSTDPARAGKVLSIYDLHHAALRAT
jgi:flagellum-specific peptidoglycan hydrolase FlgJ